MYFLIIYLKGKSANSQQTNNVRFHEINNYKVRIVRYGDTAIG